MTQADTQEETLQPESSETEDTSVNKVYIPRDQNTGPTEVPDSNGNQIEGNGTTPDNDSDD